MTTDTVCYRTSTDEEGVLIPTSTDCTSQVIYYAPWKWNTISTNSRNSSGKEDKNVKPNYSYPYCTYWMTFQNGRKTEQLSQYSE